jgi:hypothetical protein
VSLPSRDLDRRTIWWVLLSWGLAVLLIAGLLSAWIWKNEREQEAENALVKREQDRALCAVLNLFAQGPEPVPGPSGDRGRAVADAIRYYQGTIGCDDLPPSDPPR